MSISADSETRLDPGPAKLDPPWDPSILISGDWGSLGMALDILNSKKKKKKLGEILPFGLNLRLDMTSLAQKCAKVRKNALNYPLWRPWDPLYSFFWAGIGLA